MYAPVIKVVLDVLNSSSTTSCWTTIKDVLPSICTVVVAVISSYFVYKSSAKSRNQERVDKLQQDLEIFYYPFLILSKRNTQIYHAFTQNKDRSFRTLPAILEGQAFNGNDSALLKEIMSNNEKLNNLIQTHAKAIKNKDLAQKLANLSAHYTIIELAYQGNLNGETRRFDEFIHPNTICDVEKEIDTIEEEIKRLSK